jgi:hypothetical protein
LAAKATGRARGARYDVGSSEEPRMRQVHGFPKVNAAARGRTRGLRCARGGRMVAP